MTGYYAGLSRAVAVAFRIKQNLYDDPILEQPEFLELRNRLGFTDL